MLEWKDASKRMAIDQQKGRMWAAWEITEEWYEWMLGCVPPAVQQRRGFVNGEPYTFDQNGDTVYFACFEHNGHYYCSLLTVKQFRAVSDNDLDEAIARGEDRETWQANFAEEVTA